MDTIGDIIELNENTKNGISDFWEDFMCYIGKDEKYKKLDSEKKRIIKKVFYDSLTAREQYLLTKIELVPQWHWGNTEEPNIVILGANPSLLESDFVDNVVFQEYLEKNNNDKASYNLLFEDEFSNSGVSKWWKKFFNNNKIDMNEIGIFNAFGYYSTNVKYDKDLKRCFQMPEKLKTILKKKDTLIISLWSFNGKNSIWKDQINSIWKDQIQIKDDIFNRVYMANKNNHTPCIDTLFLYKKDSDRDKKVLTFKELIWR